MNIVVHVLRGILRYLPCVVLLSWLMVTLYFIGAFCGKDLPYAYAQSDALLDSETRQTLADARAAISAKDEAQAIRLFSKILEKHPNHRESLHTLGELLFRQGKYQAADGIYSRTLLVDPGDAVALTRLGLVKFHLGKNHEAQSLLSAVAASSLPDGELQDRKNKALAAIYDDWTILQDMQDQKDYAGQERFFGFQIAKAPESSGKAYALRGFVRQQMQKNEEALQDYSRALAVGGMDEDMTASVLRSKQLLEERNRPRERDGFSTPDIRNSGDREEEIRIGSWQTTLANIEVLERKNNTAALESYLGTLFDSEMMGVYAAIKRGNLRLERGAYDEAEEDFVFAQGHNPSEAARNDINRGLRRIAERRATQESASQPAVQRQPSWDDIRHRVHAYEEANDHDGLIAYVTALMEYDSTRPYALIKRAYLLIGKKEFSRAKSDLDELERLSTGEKAEQEIAKARQHLANRQAAHIKSIAEKAKAGKKAKTASWVNPYPVFKRVSDFLGQGEYEQARKTLAGLRFKSLKRPEQGIYIFYRSELELHTGSRAAALRGYHRATKLVKNDFWLASTYMRLAELYADKNDIARAGRYVERAMALAHDQAWRMQQAGRLYQKMKQPEKAAQYFRRSLELDSSPASASQAYQGLADSYKLLNDIKGYLTNAARYVSFLYASPDPLESHQQSAMAYFQAELLKASKHPESAINKYIESAGLTSNTYRLADIHFKLAECYIEMGQTGEAVEHAQKSAALLPDQAWQLRRVASLLGRAGKVDMAIDYSVRAMAQDPEPQPWTYQALAILYLRDGDRDGFSEYNRRYIDILRKEIEPLGPEAPAELQQRLYDARRHQAYGTRVWGFNSYHYGFRDTRQNYYYGMTNELYRNFLLPNDWRGKAYLHVKGSPAAYYDGNYYNQYSGRKGTWRSRKDLGDTLEGVVGFQVKPFKFLPDLGLAAEEAFPLGQNETDPDFRLRATYFKAIGKDPRLFGSAWPYAQTYADLIYSTRYNDFLAYGHARLGRTFVYDWNRNFLISPYAGVNWSYNGQDSNKGKRWGLEGGPGILFTYWFNEDEYNAPRSSLGVAFYYHWGMSHDRRNAVGFNVSLSF